MKYWLMLLMLGLLLLLAACGNDSSEPPTETDGAADTEEEEIEGEEETPPEGTEADPEGSSEIQLLTVEFLNADGDATGTAELMEEEAGVVVTLDVEGLETGTHGIYFHDQGMCEAPDFESAGDPFIPNDSPTGESPSIEVGQDGTSTDELTVENVTLAIGEENSLLKEGGTSLIIYAASGEDASDERVACGVVTTE